MSTNDKAWFTPERDASYSMFLQLHGTNLRKRFNRSDSALIHGYQRVSMYGPKHSFPFNSSISSGKTATINSAEPSFNFGKIQVDPSSPGYLYLATFPNALPQSCSYSDALVQSVPI